MLTLADWPLLLTTLGGIAAVLLFLRWYEPRMMFYPHIPSRRLEQTPTTHGIPFKDLRLTTKDGVEIHAWHLNSDAPATVLFCHGNAGNISHRIAKARTLLDLGVGVLLFDYRGYGQSEGTPDEKGLYEDVRTVYGYLTETLGLNPEKVIVYGESLGTGVATHLAFKFPVGGLILEAAYTSIPDVAQKIFWFLPVRYLVRNRFESIKKIGQVKAPLLLLHSHDDRSFSIRHAQRLLEAASEPKTLVELRGSHDSAHMVSQTEYNQGLREFLGSLRL